MVEFEYFIENERNDQSSFFKKMVEKHLNCICVLLIMGITHLKVIKYSINIQNETNKIMAVGVKKMEAELKDLKDMCTSSMEK